MPSMSLDQKPEAWSEIAGHYEGAFESLTLQFAERVAGLLQLSPQERVIDVAAGTGAFSLLAAHHVAQVLATDFAPGMVARLQERIATQKLANITSAVMDGQALEVQDSTFDVGVSILGLIFFPDIAKGLQEMRRVIRPGGRVAIVCWGDPGKFELKDMVMRAVMTAVPGFRPPNEPPVWARLSGADSLERHLTEAGIRNVKITTMTGRLEITNPKDFWADFVKSAPPLAYLFGQFDSERVERIGQVFLDILVKRLPGGVPTLTAEACLGIGVV